MTKLSRIKRCARRGLNNFYTPERMRACAQSFSDMVVFGYCEKCVDNPASLKELRNENKIKKCKNRRVFSYK